MRRRGDAHSIEKVGRLDKLRSDGVVQAISLLVDDVKALGDPSIAFPQIPICWKRAEQQASALSERDEGVGGRGTRDSQTR